VPKAKPDQVIVHRIELQDTERDLLSGMTAAFQFNRIANPLVKLLNDVTGTVTVLTLLAASGLLAGITFAFAYDPDAFMDPIEQFLGQLDEAKAQAEAAGDVYASAGGPLRGIIDLIELATGSNLPDFGAGYEPPGEPSLGSQRFNDPNIFLSEAWWASTYDPASPNWVERDPLATSPLWNEGVPTGPVQEDGTF
tara:strand:- start:187 stop:771 length:585 start_codon:yes stop_codon:yes gene_type:complete